MTIKVRQLDDHHYRISSTEAGYRTQGVEVELVSSFDKEPVIHLHFSHPQAVAALVFVIPMETGHQLARALDDAVQEYLNGHEAEEME